MAEAPRTAGEDASGPGSSEKLTLVRGTLDVLVLRILAGGPRHGYGVAAAIARRSDGALHVEDGALYQALHRLRAKGWLASEWGHAESGKRARFYELTDAGRRHLESSLLEWERYTAAVSSVLRPGEVLP